MIYVIGSGPAGVSAAHALLQQDREVTLLDVGIELETEKQSLIASLGRRSSQSWTPEEKLSVKKHVTQNADELPIIVKHVYGSDFPYQGAAEFLPIKSNQTAILPSFAKGGFSNVWGGAILPYRDADLLGWPINSQDLTPHYEAVLSFMALSTYRDEQANDALSAEFPIYTQSAQRIGPSRQARSFMQDLQQSQSKLRNEGVFFGYSRLALQAEPQRDWSGCIYCGLCLHGCPYHLIYESAATLAQFQQQKNFHYIKDVLVERLEEKSGQVKILAKNRLTKELVVFQADRVYVAAGVLPTAKILLSSYGDFKTKLTLKSAEYFLLPYLRYAKVKGVENEAMHTLAQIFLEIQDAQISEHLVHLQIYGYNDFYDSALKEKTGAAYPFFKSFKREIFERLMVIQGYLHSDISSEVSLCLDEASHKILELDGRNVDVARATVKKVCRKLAGHRHSLRGIPLSLLLQIGLPGKSNHCGGTFPMRDKPAPFESDRYGRPYGFEKVHVVDASVFPSIPATTVTFSVMANAHRIAAAYAETEK